MGSFTDHCLSAQRSMSGGGHHLTYHRHERPCLALISASRTGHCVGRRRVDRGRPPRLTPISDPGYMSRKFESLERVNSIRETNGSFDSCGSCNVLVLHELQESKLLSVSRTEFIRSNPSNFSAHLSGVSGVCSTRHCL